MEPTIFDLNEMAKLSPSTPPQENRRPLLAVMLALLIGGAMLLGVLVWRSAPSDAGILQRNYTLPAPQPINSPQIYAPVVTVTPPPAPQVVQIPPARPSLWVIRAELKRGLGEWEFPHYVNAPQFGSGPSSSSPSQPIPHIGVVLVQ
ncbi:MAG: hypothetical protein ACUVTY_14545 [Armatimonadota bacterium]